MSQANQPITLKIHHGDDIRRFHLEQLEWEELTKLLSSTYPTPYTLKYRDTDNDLVTMVSQQDLQDAIEMNQGDVLHLYVFGGDVSSKAQQPTSTTTASAPDIDMKSSDDDLSSQLSHDEIATLVSECLADPTIITAIAPFLTTFVDALTSNISHTNPLSISWQQALQQHTAIRDHVILSVLLPRMEQALIRADHNHLASRIPAHVFPMVKGFLPMLPMFLPSLIPMLTKVMSNTNNTTATDAQQQDNPLANNPLLSMLGPMLSGMQQQQAAAPAATSSSSATTTSPSTSSPDAAPFNPLSALAPLLANAVVNPGASTSPNNAAANNPLLGLLGPLLAANAANTQGNQAHPLASLLQQFAQPHDNANSFSTSNNNTSNTPPDYTEQLSQLDSMGVGNHELNLMLLQQCDGSVERVVSLLAQE